MSPEVVAIIVNYNTGDLLAKAVESVLAGSMEAAVEVVDNASTDGAVEAVRDNPSYRGRVTVTVNDRNRGFSGANNQVIRRLNAKYYLLMNPDCVLETDAVREFVAYMDSHPDVGLTGGALKNPDGSIQKTSKRRFPTPWSSLARTLGLHRLKVGGARTADFDLAAGTPAGGDAETVEAISGALMFVRGAALSRVGLLDEGYFLHCEDLDWCRRFWNAGYKVAYLPSAGAVHLKGGSGRGPTVIWHLHRGMSRFYRKHYHRQYPLVFSGLVYTGIYLRCLALMAWSLLKGGR